MRNRNSSRGSGSSRPRHNHPKIDHHLFINRSDPASKPVAVVHEIKHTFQDFELEPVLKEAIARRGFKTPTPIQDQSIPVVLQGKDVIGIANTGTGKTAAFLLPMIHKVLKNKSEKILIIAPTRELAVQICDDLKSFTPNMGIFACLAIGGSSLNMQMMQLRRNPQFLIATPGRLKDLIEHNAIYMGHYHNVILDEVDRMVDIGFIRDIQYFISLLPKDRHSLFFSATVTPEVETILRSFVTDAVRINVKTHNTAETVDQDIIKINGGQKKIEVLHDLLIKKEFTKVIVFGRTKWGVEKLSQSLEIRGFKSASIHGNKSQGQRQRALESFKLNRIQILVATDVASRGLDISGVSHVINYDPPASYDDYVHRIGRTGRANQTGKAITFVE